MDREGGKTCSDRTGQRLDFRRGLFIFLDYLNNFLIYFTEKMENQSWDRVWINFRIIFFSFFGFTNDRINFNLS